MLCISPVLVRALAVVTLNPFVIGAPIPEIGDSIRVGDESVLRIPAPHVQSNRLGTVQRACLASNSQDLLLRTFFGRAKRLDCPLFERGRPPAKETGDGAKRE